ncbi:PREDICTED: uncharacterized protein LOC108968714 [Bactrocera latifrons]|uniref:Protein stand still n=2 Tax=Bactrocera latifrons TaxID=174628 RepID=A0A0K8VHS5_BACLA|nr:PREDICTED: uncharacterized protein LOC108968714 [Bactrocera latifrons]
MEHSQNIIPVDVLRFYGRLEMEINKPTLDLANLPTTDGIALEMANKVCLGNSAQTKQKISLDTSISSDKRIVPDTNSRNVHIPYILNGELFEIQTQDGENVTVKCCNCPPDRVYRGSVRSTGNFHMHIKRRHPDLMGKIYDMKVNALVERRDRFLRNRKSTRRRNTNANGSSTSSSRNEQRLACPVQPTSELFKIKAAFQRHQLQQQQQNRIQQHQSEQQQKRKKNSSILHKWNVIDHFLITPAFERARDITLMEAYNEQPLNYSLKQNTVSNMSSTERTQEIDANDANTSDSLHPNNISGTIDTSEHITGYEVMSTYNKASNSGMNCMTINQRTQIEMSPFAFSQPEEHVPLYANNSDQSLLGRATTLSAVTPCPSDVSSYDAGQDLGGRSYDLNCNHVGSMIKNELLLAEIQPIDLSVHPTSSGLSGSSGFSSGVDATQYSNDTTHFNTSVGNTKSDEIILQLSSSLQSLHRELQTYNQTNNNWLCLEIAKFKFLHPEFEYHN